MNDSISKQSGDIWGEFVSKDGTFYYYNRIKKFSIWSKPKGLVLPLPNESHQDLLNNWRNLHKTEIINNLKAEAKKDFPKKKCQILDTNFEIVITKQNRFYFFNPETQTSSWECPPEIENSFSQQLNDAKNKLLGTHSELPTFVEGTEMGVDDISWMLEQIGDDEQDEETDSENDKITIIPENIDASENQNHQNSNLEQTLASRQLKFKEMLLEYSIDPFGSWEKEATKFIEDPRFNVIDSIQEKKSIFDSTCKLILADRKKAKDAPSNNSPFAIKNAKYSSPFDKLIHENCGNPPLDWKQFFQKFKKDPRFLSVKSLVKREKLYNEFLKKNNFDYTKIESDYVDLVKEFLKSKNFNPETKFAEFAELMKFDIRFINYSSDENKKRILFLKHKENYLKSLPKTNSPPAKYHNTNTIINTSIPVTDSVPPISESTPQLKPQSISDNSNIYNSSSEPKLDYIDKFISQNRNISPSYKSRPEHKYRSREKSYSRSRSRSYERGRSKEKYYSRGKDCYSKKDNDSPRSRTKNRKRSTECRSNYDSDSSYYSDRVRNNDKHRDSHRNKHTTRDRYRTSKRSIERRRSRSSSSSKDSRKYSRKGRISSNRSRTRSRSPRNSIRNPSPYYKNDEKHRDIDNYNKFPEDRHENYSQKSKRRRDSYSRSPSRHSRSRNYTSENSRNKSEINSRRNESALSKLDSKRYYESKKSMSKANFARFNLESYNAKNQVASKLVDLVKFRETTNSTIYDLLVKSFKGKDVDLNESEISKNGRKNYDILEIGFGEALNSKYDIDELIAIHKNILLEKRNLRFNRYLTSKLELLARRDNELASADKEGSDSRITINSSFEKVMLVLISDSLQFRYMISKDIPEATYDCVLETFNLFVMNSLNELNNESIVSTSSDPEKCYQLAKVIIENNPTLSNFETSNLSIALEILSLAIEYFNKWQKSKIDLAMKELEEAILGNGRIEYLVRNLVYLKGKKGLDQTSQKADTKGAINNERGHSDGEIDESEFADDSESIDLNMKELIKSEQKVYSEVLTILEDDSRYTCLKFLGKGRDEYIHDTLQKFQNLLGSGASAFDVMKLKSF
ncbi:Transcription elongation regulator 1 [Smittium culicis]|uniref:Transcription elongation regulator 1 n=1 Tax=Smittium culicis TaxID=133412 RepID=A0A1R1XCY7_9FUNG|nr:Transcription elongation regulator 1 [Smittium culicis]